jgi:ABC-type lipoprotein release transport system permease subunit
MKLSFAAFLKILLEGKSSKRFLVGVIGSFGFSIAVILSTIGLMDGFESTLIESLKNSNGDLVVKKETGFFLYNDQMKNLKKLDYIEEITPITQIEAFAITEGASSGVLVKGIEQKSFEMVTNLGLSLKEGEVAIGIELSKKYNLVVGDSITLTFASNQKINQGAPILRNFIIGDIADHKVYEKDLRFIYVDKEELLQVLNYKKETANTLLVKTSQYEENDLLLAYQDLLEKKLGSEYIVSTYWSEFKVLLNAVEVEKFSISLILQLIVIVAIFNIIAFIIFISEKKSQEFFLLRVLGINLKTVVRFWLLMLGFLWLLSCVVALVLTYIFDILIANLTFFKLPGDVYVLSRLGIDLELTDFALVFGLSLVWIFIIGSLSILKLKKKTLLQGLRQEFT